MAPGQGNGSQEMQLPDIIMSQEELNKQMEKGLNEGEGEDSEDNKNSENQGNKKEGQSGEGDQENENINGELYEIYQRQQQLRQALQDKLGKEGEQGEGQDILKKMEEIELDLINKGFTNQTLEKMNNLQYQLLKLDKATFMQGQENKRQSESNFKQYSNTLNTDIQKAKKYFNTIEILNRQALPLQQTYKIKVQKYFQKDNDQL
jgi:hypothetical protein